MIDVGDKLRIIVSNRSESDYDSGESGEDSLHLLAVGLQHLVEPIAAGPRSHLQGHAGLAAGHVALGSRSPRNLGYRI